MKLFEDKLDTLEKLLSQEREKDQTFLPDQWEVTKHDRALIFAVCEKGVCFLKQMRYSDDY